MNLDSTSTSMDLLILPHTSNLDLLSGREELLHQLPAELSQRPPLAVLPHPPIQLPPQPLLLIRLPFQLPLLIQPQLLRPHVPPNTPSAEVQVGPVLLVAYLQLALYQTHIIPNVCSQTGFMVSELGMLELGLTWCCDENPGCNECKHVLLLHLSTEGFVYLGRVLRRLKSQYGLQQVQNNPVLNTSATTSWIC